MLVCASFSSSFLRLLEGLLSSAQIGLLWYVPADRHQRILALFSPLSELTQALVSHLLPNQLFPLLHLIPYQVRGSQYLLLPLPLSNLSLLHRPHTPLLIIFCNIFNQYLFTLTSLCIFFQLALLPALPPYLLPLLPCHLLYYPWVPDNLSPWSLGALVT